MPTRPLVPLALVLLLGACASDPAATPPVQPQSPPRPTAAPRQATVVEQPRPAHLRELRGSLAGVPADAEVELALLVVDERDRAKRLLGNIQLRGNGKPLPFRMDFNPQAFPAGGRVLLRGRASQSGRLILRLPPRRILSADDQNLGELRLEPAP